MISMFCHSPTWAPLLVTFSKVHEFVQNNVFSPKSERFVIFALGTARFSVLSKVHEFVRNRSFQSEIRTFCHFRTGALHFSNFQKSARVCTKQKVYVGGQNVFSSSHWAHYILALFSKVQEFVQNSVFSPGSERFLIVALGTPRFSVLSKVHEFVQNRSFQSEIRTFCHFRTGRTTF